MKLNKKKIEKLIEEGYINKTKHPDLPLYILNYSKKTQFDGYWKPETIACRGLAVDEELNPINRCLPKFFTLDQLSTLRSHTFASKIFRNIRNGVPFEVFDKLDGSYLSIFNYNGQNLVATRGSFASEQADKAREILAVKYPDFLAFPNVTYVCEVIYPENRVVCDYGDTEDIFLLAVIDHLTNNELDVKTFDAPFPKVKGFEIDSLESLGQYENDTEEGFVVKFFDDSRFKFKFETYKRLHKVLTGTNTKTVWEILSTGGDISSLVENVPDEFYDWLQTTILDLKNAFAKIEEAGKAEFALVPRNVSRKEQALYITGNCSDKSLMFLMLDGKDYTGYIWDLVKPKAEKPFTKNNEESD